MRATASYIGAGVIGGGGGETNLNLLTVTPNSATVGTVYNGSISGRTAGSTLSLTGAGAAGLSVNSGTGAVTGTPSAAGTVNIVETLAGAIGSPRTSSGVVAVQSVAPPTVKVYDLKFRAGEQSSDPDGASIDPFSLGLLTHSRSGSLIAPDSDGKYYTYADGVRAVNGRGWWRRGKTRTNLCRNMNTGAVAGTPGTMPTGSLIGTTPAGLTRTIAFGASDPDLGLPYIDVTFNGTATATANVVYKWMNDAVIPANASDCYMSSCWMKFVGTPPAYSQASRVIFIGAAYGSDTQINGPRLMRRSATEGPQRFKMATQNVNARTVVDTGFQFFAVNGQTYNNLTIRVICGQFEKIDALTDDASLPILNDSASGTTYNADAIGVSGALLDHVNGGSGFVELDTYGLRASGLPHRQDCDLLGINGSTKLLKRSDKGEIASDVTGTPRTYRSYRTQYAWGKKQAISWGGGNVSVASSSAADTDTKAGTVPSISSMSIDADGCIVGLRLGNASFTSDELSAYKKRTAKFVAYGATMGGLHHAATAIKRGKTAFVVGNAREVNHGGMATGGLSVIDAINASAYQSSWGRDYLNWGAEYQNRSTLDTANLDSDISTLYCDYIIRKYEIDTHWTSGPNAHLQNWGISSVDVTGAAGNRKISKAITYRGQEFTGSHWADASYEGHLIRFAGCTFRHGREQEVANVSDFNGKRGVLAATSNLGNQSNHQITLYGQAGPTNIMNVDPWVTPGNTASGLLDGIWADDGLPNGAADTKLQAFCYRWTTTTGAPAGSGSGGNWSPMVVNGSPPPGYDPAVYEPHGRYLAALSAAGSTYNNAASLSPTTFNLDLFLIRTGVSTKSDFNNFGGLSIDGIGRNCGPGWRKIMLDAGIANPSENFAVATAREQAIYWQWQWNHQCGLLYWWAYSGDPRIPAQMSLDAAKYGRPNDIYLDPHPDDVAGRNYYLYVREAIRIEGDDVCQGNEIASTTGVPRNLDTVGISSYARDSHHVTRIPYNDGSNWKIICDGNVQASGSGMAPLSAKWFMPKKNDITNLVVTFCASVDHMAMGSFRMEMTQAEMGQSMSIIQCLQDDAGHTGAIQDFVSANYTGVIRPALIAEGIPVPQVNAA